MSLPERAPKKSFKRLSSVDELAKERFGNIEGLAIITKTTLELAGHYSDRFDLDPMDPEVSLITSALAFSRHKEFLLLAEIERDLYGRVAEHPAGLGYGEILLNATRTGAYKDIYREIDRLHSRGAVYIRELEELRRQEQLRQAAKKIK